MIAENKAGKSIQKSNRSCINLKMQNNRFVAQNIRYGCRVINGKLEQMKANPAADLFDDHRRQKMLNLLPKLMKQTEIILNDTMC